MGAELHYPQIKVYEEDLDILENENIKINFIL